MRHAHLLGASEPLLYKLLPTLVGKMGEAYPELKRAEALIRETLRSEEERFKRTLDRGLKMLDEETGKLASGKKFPGDVAFKLYDTYGFPLDLTQDALKAKNIEVDTAAFESCMAEQKKAARTAWAGSGDTGTEKLWFDLLEEIGPTEFLGYESEAAEAVVVAIVKDGKRVESIKSGEEAFVLTNQTPFYAESGGQVGDSGGMWTALGTELIVKDTKKQLGKLHLHMVKCKSRGLAVGDAVEMRVDSRRRQSIRANHSATHLLHEALRQVLGDHVAQKGSLQDAERTRFDISHPKAIAPEELQKIEALANEEIRANTPVETRLMPLDDARASGAMALFGEKYDDEVRVVSMGTQTPGANKPFSVELCGGTHVKRTGEIGLMKIVAEGALSSGIRRIEALTGRNALRYFEEQEQRVHDIADVLKASPADVVARVQSLTEEKKRLERELSDLRRKLATGGGGSGASADIKEIGGMKFTGKILEGFPAKDLKPMADDLKTKMGSGVIVLIATEGKASIVVAVTNDLTSKVSAVELVKIGAAALGGKGGGGRPDMAQAGGPNPGAANDAVAAIEKALAG